MIDIITWLKSKTFWGVIVALLGVLSDPTILAFFPANVAHILVAIGAALTALGLKGAIAAGASINGVSVHPEIAAAKEEKAALKRNS